MPALTDPRRVDVLGHMVSVDLRHEPCQSRGNHGGKDQSAGSCERTSRDAVECCIGIPCPRPADGTDRVDIACYEEEEGDGRAPTNGETKERQLEQMRGGFGVVGRRVQPGNECCAQMATNNHEGCATAKAL